MGAVPEYENVSSYFYPSSGRSEAHVVLATSLPTYHGPVESRGWYQ